MTRRTARNPHKEEDEGYLAAEAGQKLADNPYPAGTLRHADWRHGWLSKGAEAERAIRLGRVTASAGRGPI